jgi:beta-lactamase superfamily II metal-dependent hydrolase
MRKQKGKRELLKRLLLLITGTVILLSGLVLTGCGAGKAPEKTDSSAEESVETSEEISEETKEAEENGEGEMKQEDILDIQFLKCGKADAIVLSCGGQTMVIDAGEEDDGEKLVSAVKETGASQVDVLVITHFDKDHVGGADALLREMEVDRIYLPDYEGAGTDYEEFTALAAEKDLQVTRLKEDISFSLGTASVLIEPPASYETGDSDEEYDNNFSLITTVTHGDHTLVFMGDAEKDRIREWLSERADRTCDLIKIPHHGVYNKAVKELAAAAEASIAVVTDSDKNPADAKTLAAFEEKGAQIFSTRDGSVHAVSDGTSLTVSR